MSHQSPYYVYDRCKPAYRAGTKLTFTAKQQLEGDGVAISSAGTVHLVVEGAQTQLQKEDVLGVHPSPGSTTSPKNFLPHIVLSRRTLPWERVGLPESSHPWLALLLVAESELLGGVGARPTTVGAIASVDAEAHQRISNTGLSDSTGVTVVDLPRSVLQSILPNSWEEIAALTHVRSLSSESDLHGIDDDGDVAIVMGARLPSKQEKHHVFLVSLEGRDDLGLTSAVKWIPVPGLNPNTHAHADAKGAKRSTVARSASKTSSAKTFPPTIASPSGPKNGAGIEADPLMPTDVFKRIDTTSLVVLHHWNFTPSSSNGDFESVIGDLREYPSGGVLRFGELPQKPGRQAVSQEGILDQSGHLTTPIAYSQTSAGAARYRGPLVPNRPRQRTSKFAVRAAPEELSGPEAPTEPIDQSDLAAFELGRLLALSDTGLLSAMREIGPRLKAQKAKTFYEVKELPGALNVLKTLTNPREKWGANEELIRKSNVYQTDLGGMGAEASSAKLPGLGERLAGGSLPVLHPQLVDVTAPDPIDLGSKFARLVNLAK